jgi:hypothetical protein
MDPLEYCPVKVPFKLIPMPKAGDTARMFKAVTPASTETPATVKSNSPDRKCSNCRSQRIVTGSVSDSRRGRCFFAPAALKFWKITSSYGTKVESYACIDCGFIWMQTAPKILEDFVRKYCDQNCDQKVN